MSQYNYELDLSSDNANFDILKRIAPNSKVLEAGSAYGRLTKYLHEKLNCTIDIIELNETAGTHAAQYANKALIGLENGNLNSDSWIQTLNGEQYDYIVFADVLEHLYQPEKVLNICKQFLKENGSILCSVPNICHASVILSMLAGQFQYTDVGLLDSTHVHFFTNKTFRDLCAKCGYQVSYEHAIVVPVGTNEIPFQYSSFSKEIENFLRSRPNNEAYQYVFELKKNLPGVQINEFVTETQPPSSRRCICQIKEAEDSDFSLQKSISKAISPHKTTVQFVLQNYQNPEGILIHLIDCNAFIHVEKITCTSGDNKMEITSYDTNALQLGNGYLLSYNETPVICFHLPKKLENVIITCQYEVLTYNSDCLALVGRYVSVYLQESKAMLGEKINQLNGIITKQSSQLEVFQSEKDNLQLHASHLEGQISQLNAIVSEQRLQLIELEAAKNSIQQLTQKQQIHIEKVQRELAIALDNNKRTTAELEKEQHTMNETLKNSQQISNAYDEAIQQLVATKEQLQQITERELAFEEQVRSQNEEIARLYKHIEDTKKTISYRVAAPIRGAGYVLRGIKRNVRKAMDLPLRAGRFYSQYGLKATLKRVKNHQKIEQQKKVRQEQIELVVQNQEQWDQLSRWIDETPHEFIDIFPVPMGWNTPLFQRFQHLSLQAGNAGGISFYGAHPQVDKDVETFKFVSPTLCIVNLLDGAVVNKFWQILDQKQGLKYLRVQSIDLATTIDQLKDFFARGYQIVYEYIDELTPQITGNIPQFVFERHEYILKNENITVVATSDKLFSQVAPYRSQNMLMLNNGVDYDHWHIKRSMKNCPDDIRHIVSQNKIIVGYHGALAQWVDYTLLRRIADDNRIILLLIGHEHDGRLKESGLLDKKNVYFIGARPYHQLNQYAIFYDIAILPFVINNITLSVSPVKIFEYMAADKPVVTYALPECKKYASCLCADTQDEFMEQIEKAITLRNDQAYIQQLREDALNNTWTAITKKMVQYVQIQHAKTQILQESQHILNPKLSDEYKRGCLEQMLWMPKGRAEEYQEITKTPYERKDGDCKVIAYYLTQFHPDPHNEEWWGKGVTEWNNVCRAVPQYIGHYQPRLPGELGFYDLRIKENMQRQIELAQMYGVYGFSFYYYWFDGERLLERPLEAFLSSPELNFPFSLCWANENWTKRYDGTNTDILMEQPKTSASYRNVIHDMSRFLKDSRYIEVDGKKMITVYRPSLMPETKSVLSYWRKYCKKHGIGELYIIAVKENMVDVNWLDEGFDAVSEFHPGTLYTNCQKINPWMDFLRKDFSGEVFSYADIVQNQKYFKYDYPKLYRAVMPMWDNTARRDNKGMIFEGSTPELYKRWMKDVIQAGAKRDDLEDNLIFINAWNEWGEGAYLEPDKRFGYAYLNATKEAVEESR